MSKGISSVLCVNDINSKTSGQVNLTINGDADKLSDLSINNNSNYSNNCKIIIM